MDCTCNVREDAKQARRPEYEYAHEPFCQGATISKGEVVELIENGSGSIIEDYLLLLADNFTHEEVKQQAVNSAVESVSCFLGLGSCWGGSCNHA